MAGLNPFSLGGDGAAEVSRALGLMVSGQALYGVLLERSVGGTQLIRRLSRQRGSDYASAGPVGADPMGADFAGGAAAQPGAGEAGDDFTLQIGEEAGGGDLFISSEFGDLSGADGDPFGAGGGQAAAVPSFALELTDLIGECSDIGYDEAEVAFCLPATEVHTLELHAEDAAPGERLGRKKLLKLLAGQYDGAVDKERAAFLPMTPTAQGAPRYLALIGQVVDPVTATLAGLKEDKQARQVPARLLETEISLYFGLARALDERQRLVDRSRARAAEDEADADDAETGEDAAQAAAAAAAQAAGQTLVVRVGSEDTLVLFLEGGALRHAETLRSLTAFDAAETICSRVLLLQDENGIGEVGRVLLVSKEQEEALAASFEVFFAEAQVERLLHHLPGTEHAGDADPTQLVPALAAALRLTGHTTLDAFEEVNLLPKELTRSAFTMPVSWHVPALYLVLFAVTFFFMARYFSMEQKITEAEVRIQQYATEEVTTDPRVVQARIDSLKQLQQEYVRGLEVLDLLLSGSDRWSRALAGVSQSTAAVRGVWVESWQATGNELRLSGNATTRDRIVRLAERLDGALQQVTFAEVRDWPVYSFTMTTPLYTGLPEVTQYLRQHVATAETPPDARPPARAVSLRDDR